MEISSLQFQPTTVWGSYSSRVNTSPSNFSINNNLRDRSDDFKMSENLSLLLPQPIQPRRSLNVTQREHTPLSLTTNLSEEGCEMSFWDYSLLHSLPIHIRRYDVNRVSKFPFPIQYQYIREMRVNLERDIILLYLPQRCIWRMK